MKVSPINNEYSYALTKICTRKFTLVFLCTVVDRWCNRNFIGMDRIRYRRYELPTTANRTRSVSSVRSAGQCSQ